jgi:DNA-binding LytR/AlgR family response regulator
MRILVVDDDVALRNTIVRFIEKLGHTVVTASNAWAAFEETEKATFDAVITDVQMPGGSGIDLLQMLWRLEVIPPTYVHSSEAYFYFNGAHIELGAHVTRVFGEYASFKLKDGETLKNIDAFLKSILLK